MSPISQWQSMKIYRKLRTNKILRLFAFFIYDSTAARTLSCFHSLSLSTLSLSLSLTFSPSLFLARVHWASVALCCLVHFLGLLKCIFLTLARHRCFPFSVSAAILLLFVGFPDAAATPPRHMWAQHGPRSSKLLMFTIVVYHFS